MVDDLKFGVAVRLWPTQSMMPGTQTHFVAPCMGQVTVVAALHTDVKTNSTAAINTYRIKQT